MPEKVGTDLIQACGNNDRTAQRRVYELLFPAAMRICKRYCSKGEEAMEVLNTGFLKVFMQLGSYRGQGSFEGWVKRIMVNTALDHVRKESKHQQQFILTDQFEEYTEDLPGEETMSSIGIDLLYGFISELPPVSRMVFNLYVFEEYSHAAIAGELGISTGTSKWHLSNARTILKARINTFCLQESKNGK
ncbi:MAG TPA: sigma-70 family RNA polymerase sigma factor [Bacteroidales bacterium]|nr:sigma-70 family RNA polymerase sigma factor [Bacteroidales bacterium]